MQVIFHHLKTVLERVHVGHGGMGAVSVSVLGVLLGGNLMDRPRIYTPYSSAHVQRTPPRSHTQSFQYYIIELFHTI